MSDDNQITGSLPASQDSLRAARESAGVTLADLSQKTRISVKQLEALEAGRYSDLPGIAFVKGAMRSCAKVLNLDAQVLLAHVQANTLDPLASGNGDRLAMPMPADRGGLSSGGGSRLWFWGAALLALVALGFFFASPEQWRAAISQMAPKAGPAQSAKVSAPANPTAVAAVIAPIEASPTGPSLQTSSTSSAPVALPAVVSPVSPGAVPDTGLKRVDPLVVAPPAVLPTGSVIEMQFARDSWVEVRQADGKIINNQLHKAGTKAAIDAQGPVALIIGGASGVSVNWQGQAQDIKPFTRDDVARLTLK